MQTFTYKEEQYLLSLLERNFKNGFEGKSEPLNRPMDIDERKLRSRMRKKCDTYIYQLVLAELAGLLPDKKMKENSFSRVSEAIEKIGFVLILENMAKKGEAPTQ
jgi:hypothetical protein